MLSPLLEQLVLSNQATVKTHNHGVGGVGTILVPKGKQIIITQIIWNPFLDVKNQFNTDKVFTSGSLLHTLKLRNKRQKFAFTFRDSFDLFFKQENVGSRLNSYVAPKQPVIVNTYLPFVEGDVDIDIMKFEDFNKWQVLPSVLPESTIEPIPGEGYGTIATAPDFYFMSNMVRYRFGAPFPEGYYPPTAQRLGFTTNQFTNEFEADKAIEMPSIVNNPDTDVDMFPIVTFTYVEINARYVPGNTLQTVDPKKK